MNCGSDGYGQLAGGVDDGQRAGIIISREYAAYAPGKCNHEQALADSRQKTCSDRNFHIGSEKQTEPSCGSDGGNSVIANCGLTRSSVEPMASLPTLAPIMRAVTTQAACVSVSPMEIPYAGIC